MESKWQPSQPIIDEFCTLIHSGMSVRKAAKQLDMNRTTAYRIAKALDLPIKHKTVTSQQTVNQIIHLYKQGQRPMDIARYLGIGFTPVYRVGIQHGYWQRSELPRRAAATRRRVQYLQLRVHAFGRNDAAHAVGIHPRSAQDIDKGLIKTPKGRIPFVPAGVDASLYKRLMSVLEYVDGRVAVPVEVIPQARIDQRIHPRYLSIEEREMIADLRDKGKGVRAIARHLGRAPSTISKELNRNRDEFGLYCPRHAHRQSVLRRFRPKQRKIDANPALHDQIWSWLNRKFSPAQIAARLRKDYPDDQTMWVCHETIYQCLYFQARGHVRKDVAQRLRRGRTIRKPRHGRIPRKRFIDDMIMISDRPAEVEDRAIPGHWEGDLILGKNNASAIGTLVERTTRFVMLLHLPNGHDAVSVRDALVETIGTLPEHLRASLTWDQGSEMAGHKSFTIATGCPVYFCDPASPWQRGSNENTNGLLRQYFPKGTDLSVYSKEDLEFVAQELNMRPRATLDFDTPAERMAMLLGFEL